jgi:hypothetical protein
MAVASQADTVVKWGESGGDTTIVTSSAAGQNPWSTTYSDVDAASPLDGTGGYALDAAGQTRTFYAAKSVSNGVAIVNNANAPSADHIQMVNNFGSGNAGSITGMVAWQAADFLTADRELESLSLQFQTRAATGAANASFLLETSAGWYKSDQSYTSTSAVNGEWASVSAVAGDLTWSAYSDFGVTGGAVAADITDVKSIGLYIDGSATTTWAGAKIAYFEVTAIPEPAALGLIAASAAGILFIRRRFMI